MGLQRAHQFEWRVLKRVTRPPIDTQFIAKYDFGIQSIGGSPLGQAVDDDHEAVDPRFVTLTLPHQSLGIRKVVPRDDGHDAPPTHVFVATR
jgi:hypothetical protein